MYTERSASFPLRRTYGLVNSIYSYEVRPGDLNYGIIKLTDHPVLTYFFSPLLNADSKSGSRAVRLASRMPSV